MCTCVEGNNVGLLCREHGEIPEQNSMVLGRFMIPSCVGLRDVLGGWGRLGWCSEVQGSKCWMGDGWEIPRLIYKVWVENFRAHIYGAWVDSRA